MKKDEYVSEIEKAVQSSLGNDYEVTTTVVTKNNDVKHYGVSVREKDSAVAQVHYVPFSCDPERENVTKRAQEIVKTVNTTSLPDELKSIKAADLVTKKDSIVIKLVNGPRNVEYLKNAPHRHFIGDLEISYVMLLSFEANGYSSTLITNDLLRAIDLAEEELYQVALQNTIKHFPASIKSMSSVLQTMMGSNEDEQEADMYVVTNDRKVNGSNILLYPDVLKNFCEKHHYKKVFIIPSSIHEVLLIRSEIVGNDINGLQQMVGEVNNSEVDADEILSYNVYQYEYAKDKVSIAEGR